MEKFSIIALDLAKSVFQVHAREEGRKEAIRKKLSRRRVLTFFEKCEPCVVAMEACATAHHWGRLFRAMGHEVRLVPPRVAKGYRQGAKNDASDARAIALAALDEETKFVPLKSKDQQAVLGLHRARDLLVRQRTRAVNSLRGLLAEFGVHVGKGIEKVPELVKAYASASAAEVPSELRPALDSLALLIGQLDSHILTVERRIVAWHRGNRDSLRLATIPGVGPITASALVVSIGDIKRFGRGRDLAAWLGLVPRQNSSGGKLRLGRISKTGDRYLRTLLVLGATGLLRRAQRASTGHLRWIAALRARKAGRLVSVAAANKAARIVWALLTKGSLYDYDRRTQAGQAASAGATA